MAAVAWVSLILLVVVIAGGTALLTMKTIHALRAFRALQQSVGPVLGDILRRTADTEARLARMDAGSARLEEAVSRLQASRAQVAVLADALGDVRTASRGVRAAIMRR